MDDFREVAIDDISSDERVEDESPATSDDENDTIDADKGCSEVRGNFAAAARVDVHRVGTEPLDNVERREEAAMLANCADALAVSADRSALDQGAETLRPPPAGVPAYASREAVLAQPFPDHISQNTRQECLEALENIMRQYTSH